MKLPIISEEQAVAQANMPRASPGEYAQVAAAGAGLAASGVYLGSAITHAGQVFARAEAALRNEDMKLDAAEKLNQVREKVAGVEIEAKQRLANPDHPKGPLSPAEYGPLVAKEMERFMGEASAQLKYPESQTLFRRQSGTFQTDTRIKAAREGLGLWEAQMKARDELLTVEDVNQAVYGKTPALQQEALDRALERVRSGVEAGRYTGGEGGAKLKGILSDVTRGKVELESADPAKRPGVVNALTRGLLPSLGTPADQLTVAREIQDRATRDQRQNEADSEKKMQKQADVFVARFIDSWNTGKPEDRMDLKTLREGMKTFEGHISRDAQIALLATASKPELEGGITRPEVFNNLRIAILANPRDPTHQDAILRESPLRLSMKDKGDLLTKVQQLKDETDVSRSPFYQKGREQIMVLLGGVPTGLPEFLGLPILKPAEADNLAKTLFLFDQKARSPEYQNTPEKLTELGRSLAIEAKGGQAGLVTPAPSSAPTPGGAPKVDLPKMGEPPAAPKTPARGSNKAIPR